MASCLVPSQGLDGNFENSAWKSVYAMFYFIQAIVREKEFWLSVGLEINNKADALIGVWKRGERLVHRIQCLIRTEIIPPVHNPLCQGSVRFSPSTQVIAVVFNYQFILPLQKGYAIIKWQSHHACRFVSFLSVEVVGCYGISLTLSIHKTKIVNSTRVSGFF